MSLPIDYFRKCCDEYKGFVGRQFTCEDLNLVAFHSLESFRNWYGQPPGIHGTPYRDEAFYLREISHASMEVQPMSIVELGTNLGIGTLILRILNPKAHIISVDNREMIPACDGQEYPAGSFALLCGSNHVQIIGDSKAQKFRNVDLVFIDGDHSEDAVSADSKAAWGWINQGSAIVWHDYSEQFPGVIHSVDNFCREKGLVLNRYEDSSTVWALINSYSK